MTTSGDWRPLIEGEEAQQLWQVIFEVAAAVEGPAPAKEGSFDPEGPVWEAGLSSGAAGLALFYSYLAEARSDEAYADLAMARLDQALDALATLPMPPSLYSGFSGVAWTMEHLKGRLFESGEEDDDGPVSEALLTLLDRESWEGDYDLIGGLVGFGVYALEALPHPRARQVLERLVEHLERLAKPQPVGLAWFTAPELLPPHQREMAPDGYYNLGVAHGIPGVIGLLSEIYGAGIAREPTLALLDGAVSWLLSQVLDTDGGRCFPHFLFDGAEHHLSRLAWCYGDPGIAVTLFLAARHTGREDWERAALETAKRCAVRPEAAAGIRDAGLCHGSAGIGHLLNRLYQATGDEEMAAAARFWFRRTLETRRPGEEVAGFPAWEAMNGGWVPHRGFLTGAVGVGLALLAAVSSVAPDWDRLMLTAVPPQEGAR